MMGTLGQLIVSGVVFVLITQLGDVSYVKREKAMRSLKELVPIAYGQLAVGVTSSDAEIAHRCFLLYRDLHEKKQEEKAFSLRKVFPWLHLDDYCSSEVHGYMERGKDRWGGFNDHPDYTPYRNATKLWVYYQLVYGGMTIAEIQRRLDLMEDCERNWKRAYKTDQ